MEKKYFILSNCTLTSLNYWIYVKNIYDNMHHGTISFPHFEFDKRGFIDYEAFLSIYQNNVLSFIRLLSHLSPTISQSTIYQVDVQLEESYPKMFLDHEHGKKVFSQVWESFESWWFKDYYGGRYIIEDACDRSLPIIYQKVMSKVSAISPRFHNLIILGVFQRIDVDTSRLPLLIEPLYAFADERNLNGVVDRIVHRIKQ